MRGIITRFGGIAEKDAHQNMAAFILHLRNLAYFTGNKLVDWFDDTWDLRPVVKSRTESRSLVLHFVTFESAGRMKKSDKLSLPSPFKDAAKALIADSIRSGKKSAPMRRLMALRAIEKAFRDLGKPADIAALDHNVLDTAAALILSNNDDQAGIIPALAQLARFIGEKRLSVAHIDWKSPAPPKLNQRRSVQVREDGSSTIVDKLPHVKLILDLASVFQNAVGGADMVTTAWFALSMFAPNRISEVLTLPLRCETEMGDVYGLSWRPSKGGAPLTKFATNDEWADVAQKAIARLRDCGAPARRAAAWYSEHPGELFLPPGFEHLRGQGLTQHEVYGILGVGEGDFNNYTLSRVITPSNQTTHDPARTGGRAWTRLYTFSSLERYVLDHLPKGFPFADREFGLLAKDALFCVPRHTMRANFAAHMNVPELIDASQIHADLNDLASTIFVRHNLRDPTTGQHWKLTSNQPRHLLNTLAQSKNLSQALIAFWSGRKRVDQNKWYNHVPQEVFIELYVALGKDAPRQISVVGPLSDKVAERARKEAISPDKALGLETGSIISTRFGLCRHNYALTPCPKDKNCIGCGENTFIKGDARHLAEARSQLALAEIAINNCQAAIADDEPGVMLWLTKHSEARSRWAQAINMMLDPNLEDGTLITLPPPIVSETRSGLAMAIREADGAKHSANFVSLDDMLASVERT